MMRVTVDIIPEGNEDRAREIARLEIWNRDEEPLPICDYGWEAKLDTHEMPIRGEVRHRRDLGWYPLVEKVCAQLWEQVRTVPPSSVGRDDRTTEKK